MADNNGQGETVPIMDERDREIERWRQKCTRLEAHVSLELRLVKDCGIYEDIMQYLSM